MSRNCHDPQEKGRVCISKVPIFNHLEPDQMEEIHHLTHTITLERGDTLYRAGETSDALYILSTGKIRIFRVSEAGKERLLHILHPGDFTGELALFNESTHESFAEAMENTVICTLRRGALQELMKQYPAIAMKILGEFANRLETAEEQATRFVTERVETRLALYLLELGEEGSSDREVILPMSKKDLASYLGTTPETISRKLQYLEENRLIEQRSNRVIRLLDRGGLAKV